MMRKSVKPDIKNKINARQIRRMLLFILLILFVFNLAHFNLKADVRNSAVKENLKLISSYDFSSVSAVEKKLEAEGSSTAPVTVTRSGKENGLSKAKYRQIFDGCAVIGDSITEGLTTYGFLSDSQVFYKVGGSVMHGDAQFRSAANTYPKVAFFTFGMNDMGNYRGSAENFVARYETLLKEFHKTSPSTKLMINSISTPSAAARKKNKSLRNYRKFNSALRRMCRKMNLTYIDNNYILEENPKFYGSDGIHVSSGYYVMWLNNMILKAGL